MNLLEFRDMLLTVDLKLAHYESKQKDNYTVWAEYGDSQLKADDTAKEHVLKIQIDRFTKIEYDPMADAITQLLDDNDIVYEYLVDFEKDTGYIHHVWDCEVD